MKGADQGVGWSRRDFLTEGRAERRDSHPPEHPKRAPNGSRPRIALLTDPLLARMVELVLSHLSADCRMVGSRQELRSLISSEWTPQVVLVDLDLHERGPEWTRIDGTAVPSIGMTRRRETKVKLDAYERGVFDVIEVPFTPDEIVVRTMATFARAHGMRPQLQSRIQVGSFEADLIANELRLDSTRLHLTPIEQTLLYLFLSHPGEVLTREGVLTNVWGVDSAVTSNVIDRHIRDLRVKLGESWRAPRFIETVPGQGYRLIRGAAGAEPPGVQRIRST